MKSSLNKNWWWLIIIVVIIAVNFLGSIFHERIDLTNEKRFTISSPVKKILKNLDETVDVDIFLTGELPAGFKKLSTSAQELLQEVKLYSGTKTVITPPELNSAEALLEFKFANAIHKIIENHKPMVAYATGNGEPTGANTYDLVENVLRKNYSLFTMDLDREPLIPDTFKLLIIVKPTKGFTDVEKLKLDQYVMHGGKLLCFIDRLEAETDSLQIKNQVVAYDRNLQLEDLFFKYGVRINPDLLMDLQCDFLPFSVNGKDQFEFLHWNYFPLFESKQNSVINK